MSLSPTAMEHKYHKKALFLKRADMEIRDFVNGAKPENFLHN
jgi:hypothetical protein